MRGLLLFLIPIVMSCKSVPAQMTTRVVRDSLFIPWELVYGPDNHVWFTQKNGYICRLEPVSGHIDTVYHETNTVIQNEGGMLGMALDPNFFSQPYVYVAYNYLQSTTYKERIVKYTYSGGVLQSPQVLLDNLNASSIHNGCRLVIVGDKLFITSGDASTSSIAQNVNAVNGKILRINLDGSIPSDNPLPGNPAWSWGHRNAQGMVYANNKLYISEHGPANDDEISIVEKGRNYGWPTVQGYCNTTPEINFCNDSNVVEPIMAWTPTIAPCGMDYYSQPMFPNFQQCLLMTTLKGQKLFRFKLNSSFDDIVDSSVVANVNYGRLRDICISPDGKIYLSTSSSTASGTGTRIDKIIEIYDPSYVGVAMQPKKTEGIKVYPNPADELLNIELASGISKLRASYTIINSVGQIAGKGALGLGINQINTRSLQGGIYNIIISEGKKILLETKIRID
jgi:glucose/arabinose dehydrogenase